MDNLTPITREEMLMNDEPLTPITREEKILAGEDLNPVTRREYFLKKYRHADGDVMVEGLEVTANGTYTAPEGKAYSPVEVAVPLPENAYLLKTASGSLVSFSDGADLPMPSFICNIDAVQDLHGYDHPWVGGAGKNLLQNIQRTQEINGVTFTVNSDGSVTANGTATESAQFYISIDTDTVYGDLYFVGCSDGSYSTYSAFVWDNTTNNRVKKWNGTTASESSFDGTLQEIKIVQGHTVYMVLRVSLGQTVDNVTFYPMICSSTESDPTFAPYSNICPISGHTGVDAVISPTTEASAGTTYSVSWQTEAGEVFGGYVDLVSGELTVTHKSRTGFTRGSQDSSNKLYVIGGFVNMKRFTASNTISPYFIDSMFEKMSLNGARATETPSITQVTKTLCVGGYIGKEAELDTLLETLQIKYELETPITYQLTPTQIKSLLGNNNAWCDTGDVDIDYFAKEVTG